MRHSSFPKLILSLAVVATATGVAQADFLVTFDNFAATANSEVPSTTSNSGFKAVRPGHFSVTNPLIFTVAGLKITVYRENNATFDIIDNTLNSQVNKGLDAQGNLVTDWGTRSIDGFSDKSNSPFVINFEGAAAPDSDEAGGGNASPVGAASVSQDPTGLLYFSLIAGDYGGDSDVLQMQAWSGRDGTGDLLGQVSPANPLPENETRVWTEQRFHFAVDEEDSDRIRSVRFFGGLGDLDVFLDRFAGSIGTNIVPDTSQIDGPLAEVIFDSDATFVPEPTTALLLGGSGLLLLRRRRG